MDTQKLVQWDSVPPVFYLYIAYLTSPPTLFYFFSINLPRAHLIHFCLLLLNWAQIGPCALGLNLTR